MALITRKKIGTVTPILTWMIAEKVLGDILNICPDNPTHSGWLEEYCNRAEWMFQHDKTFNENIQKSGDIAMRGDGREGILYLENQMREWAREQGIDGEPWVTPKGKI